MSNKRITVVETDPFVRRAKALLDDATKQEIIDAVAENPEIGELIQGTGGCRKWRIARPGGGKSGGFRVIHYYYDETVPVFLLTVFDKTQQVNITKAERNALKDLSDRLVSTYRKKTEVPNVGNRK